MFQQLIGVYLSRKRIKTEDIVKYYSQFSGELAHEIFDLRFFSPELIALYYSTQIKLKKARDKLSRLQAMCDRHEPVRQSS